MRKLVPVLERRCSTEGLEKAELHRTSWINIMDGKFCLTYTSELGVREGFLNLLMNWSVFSHVRDSLWMHFSSDKQAWTVVWF